MATPKTLYEYYTSLGKTLPPRSERAKLYEQFGLGKASEYVGTAEQNTSLLNKLLSQDKQQGLQQQTQIISPVSQQTTQTFPIQAPKDEGMSASFLAAMTKTLPQISESLSKLEQTAISPEEDKTLLEREKELRKKQIAQQFESAREEIRQQRERGFYEIEKVGESLRIPEGIASRKIKDFQQSTDEFISKLDKAIKDLNEQEQLAYESLDIDYAKQLRQLKLDYINTQRQILQDKFNLLANAFNLMLTGKQYQRQEKIDAETEANNKLNTIISTYSGMGYENLSPQEKQIARESAEILGIPLETIKSMMSSRDIKGHISTDNAIYFYDKNGNIVKSIPLQKSSSGDNVNNYLNAYLSGEISGVSSVPQKYKGDFLSTINEIKQDAIGNLIWNERISLTNKYNTYITSRNSPQQIREMIVSKVVNYLLTKTPNTAKKILGKEKLTSDDKEILTTLVRKFAETLIPDDFIQRAKTKSIIPDTDSISVEDINL